MAAGFDNSSPLLSDLPGPPKQPVLYAFFFSFCGRKLVRFYGRKTKLHVVVGVIKSINFRVYLIASDQTHFAATVVFPSVMQIEATHLDFD